MASAYPQLFVHPLSGLSFPWSEYVSRSGSTFDASFGNDGVGLGMCMLIYYQDLNLAIKELLGYSQRDPNTVPQDRRLIRHLPFRHPRWPQYWCTRIAKIQGIQFRGKELLPIELKGRKTIGAVTVHTLFLLTLQFSRPPYAILDDADDLLYDNGDHLTGKRQEWKRFTDRVWSPSLQVLSREGMQFKYTEGTAATNKDGTPTDNQFPGSVGERLTKIKLTRTWYQIPETGIYNTDGFPNKLYLGNSYNVANVANNGAAPAGFCRITTTGDNPFLVGQTVVVTGVTGTTWANGCSEVTTVVNATTFDTNHPYDNAYAGLGAVTSYNLGTLNLTPFMGMLAGTLLFELPEIIIRPLPIPAELMGLLRESVQLQYDIKFHFEYFDPPQGTGVTAMRGHNLMPWASDGLWYPVKSVGGKSADGTVQALPRSPFPSSPFDDLFVIA